MTFWDGFVSFFEVFKFRGWAHAAGVLIALLVLLTAKDLGVAVVKWVMLVDRS